jgi:hypothetical protein
MTETTFPYILVIVDVQMNYLEDYLTKTKTKPFLVEILKTIKQAKADKAGIINLTYKDRGRTHPSILRALKGYPYKFRYIKNKPGGSNVIPNLNTKEFRLCGLYYHDCVAATSNGLRKRFKCPVKRIKKACLI